MRQTFLINADSQQYIFTIRIDFIISDIIFIRSSVTSRILVLKIITIRKRNLHRRTKTNRR
jgi:hypothetical protein